MGRVLCDASILAVSATPAPNVKRLFYLSVKGKGEHAGITRLYHLLAENEDEAAFTAIDRFVKEFSEEGSR